MSERSYSKLANRRKKANASAKSQENAKPRKVRKHSKKRAGLNRLTVLVVLFLLLLIAILVIKVISYVGGISRTMLSDEGFTHNAKYENCLKIKGIDVSLYQNKVHWKKVKSSGADFVFIRAAYRKSDTGELMEDDMFKENIKGASNSGIMVGAYIYSQALNAKEAEEEADFLVSLVKKYDIDLPLVIDYELYPGGRLVKAIENEELYAASQFNEIVTVFCRRVEEAGYESAIYGNYDMFTNYMDATLIDDKYTLWAAQYGPECHVEADYMFWQATDQAACGGITEAVDLDFWYIEPGHVYPTQAKGKKNQTSIGDCTFEFSEETVKLKNHRAEPELSVSLNGKSLKEGRDYEVSFIQNIAPGTGYAIVRGIKKYKDWTAVPFAIE